MISTALDQRRQFADPIEVLEAIADSRALRFCLAEIDWYDAVDGAWAASIKLGIETNVAQAILSTAFEAAREA